MTSPAEPSQDWARIDAPSRQKALDWCLVLASQHIESIPDCAGEPPGWFLLVPRSSLERANEAITQYEIENRAWPLRHSLFESGPSFDTASLAWAILLVVFFASQQFNPGLQSVGTLNPLAIAEGQWWRPFTAIMLHLDTGHLISNAVLGTLVLGLAMGALGPGTGLLGAYLAGVIGNILAYLLRPASPPYEALGASGMVFGALGLLAAHWTTVWIKTRHRPRHAVSGAIAAILIFVFLGMSPQSDLLAHAGGFVGGLGIGLSMARHWHIARKPSVNLLAGICTVVVIIGPWYAAFIQMRR